MIRNNNNKTDALNDYLIIIKIHLNIDFKNTKKGPVCKVTAPNGYTEMFRQTLSQNCKERLMWQNCGCKIEDTLEDRQVNGCNINGVELKQVDLRILEYTTVGKENATRTYHDKIKPGLKELGYIIVGRQCKPHKPLEEDCFAETLLDEKYYEE